MPSLNFPVIYTFQKGYTKYSVQYNVNTGTISFVTQTVSFYDNTQLNPGAPLSGVCDGTTYITFVAQNAAPFAQVSQENPNSANCGSTGPVTPPLVLNNIVVTDETAVGANDGTLSANVSGGTGPYTYSIDNNNFFLLNGSNLLINGIAPGEYILTVFDIYDVTKQYEFTVNAYMPTYGCTDPTALNYDPLAEVDNGTCVYPAPEPNEPNTQEDARQNLYETVDQFRLINKAGQIFLIDMPQGWDSVVFVIKRDEKYHGVNYEFADGAIELSFDAAAGMELLKAEFDKNGNDGFMEFQFGAVYPDGNFIPDIDGFIDFNIYRVTRDFVATSVKRKTFNDAIETKNDVDVTIKDGLFTLPLHSKLIQRNVSINRDAYKSTGRQNYILSKETVNLNLPTANAGDSPYLAYWSFLDFAQPAENESGYNTFVNDLTPNAPLFGITASNPINTAQYLFETDGGGTFSISLNFGIWFRMKLQAAFVGNPRHGYWSYKWFVVVNDLSKKYEIPGAKNGYTDSVFNDVYFENTGFNLSLNLNQGDRVYLYGQYICEDRGNKVGVDGQLDLIYMGCKITANTLATPSTTKAMLSFEVCQNILNGIGNNIKLVSNLLGRANIGYQENGCAALMAYTNGYLIRGFDLEDRPLIINLTDFIEGLDTNYAIGMAYELDVNNNWVWRLEHMEYFYRDVNIMTFSDVSDYDEKLDNKMVFNSATFGYQKTTKELERVSTIDEFLTEHKHLFPIESYKAEFVRKCKQIAGGYPIELTRRIQFKTNPDDSWAYDEDNFIISVVPDDKYGYRPEKLENFTASGIVGIDTVYNLRFTITRMLARWGKFINSILAFKTNAAVIENTYTSKNGDLTSQYTGTQACESKVQFTEAEDLFKGDLAGGEQLFFPMTITFKTRCSWETIRELKRCFANKDTQDRNNGYISVIDGDGNTQQGYPLSIEYNAENELTTFVLRKKYVDLNEPFDCSVYSAWTFGDFEAATGLPSEIEQCKFENFL